MNCTSLSPRHYHTKVRVCINSICRAEADPGQGQGTEADPDLCPEAGRRATAESREADPDPGPDPDPDPDPGTEQAAIWRREETGSAAGSGGGTAGRHGLAGQRGTVDLRQGQGGLWGEEAVDLDPDPDPHQAVARSLRMAALLLTGHLGTVAGMVRARQAPAAPGMKGARQAPAAVPAGQSRIGFKGGARRTRGRMTTAADTMRRRRRAGL